MGSSSSSSSSSSDDGLKGSNSSSSSSGIGADGMISKASNISKVNETYKDIERRLRYLKIKVCRGASSGSIIVVFQ